MEQDFSSAKIYQKNYFALISDLLEYIQKNQIPVGGKLPDENKLARDLHACRPTLREALKILDAFGITESRRGSGNTYVKAFQTGFTNICFLYSMVCGSSVDFISMRATLEASAIDSFIENATEEDFQNLEYLFRTKMRRSASTEEYVAAHTEFHSYLLKYYSNELAENFIAGSIQLMCPDQNVAISASNLKGEALDSLLKQMEEANHERILAALRARDASVSKTLIIQHILIPAKHMMPKQEA